MIDTGSKGNSTPSKGSPNQVSGLDESMFLSTLKNEYADIRFADKGGKPEDQGLNFPEYACHGGGRPYLPRFEGMLSDRIPNLDQGC